MLNYWERYVLSKSPIQLQILFEPLWLPCFITSITTAVGFGSFATSSIIPLNQYGIQSFLVMLFSYIIVMTGVPFLLRLIPPKVRSVEDVALFPSLLSSLLLFIQTHTKKIVFVALLFTLIVSQALWKAETETSFISVFFKKAHPVRQNVEFVDHQLTGSGRLDVLIRATQADAFKSIDTFHDIRQRVTKSLGYSLIKGVQDVTVPVHMIHQAFNNAKTAYPNSNDELEQELLFLEFSRGETKTDVLSSVVDFNYQNTRIEFITDQLPTSKIKEVISILTETFADVDYGNISITGSQFLSYVLGEYVLQSQFITVLITLSFVWVLFISIFVFDWELLVWYLILFQCY